MVIDKSFLRPSANSCASLGRYFLRQEFLFISLEMVDTETLNVFAIKENEELVASKEKIPYLCSEVRC